MKQVYELHGQGLSVRAIARRLGVARNSVRKYLRAPEPLAPKSRPTRGSKLDPYKAYVRSRIADGVENSAVLLRELRARGYGGGVSILKDYVQPLRRPRTPAATVRFETAPGEQAQVDWGVFRYTTPDGGTRSVWAFVMVLSWSRALYVEFVRRADVSAFVRCHLHAFERFGGVPRRCLYDNAKVVVLGRDDGGEPVWNERFLDFALRLGFGVQLCRPYRAQTKGRVESGVKYVRGNFWPGARFVDDADLNGQARAWLDGVADARLHGTTHERPADRLVAERASLHPLPGRERLAPFLREDRTVGRDGFVQWERSWYGLPWPWPAPTVQVQADGATVQLWTGEQRLAVHPRASRPGQRFTAPGQWDGLRTGDARPRREALAAQVPTVEVERRPLAVYAALAGGDR